MRRVLVTGVGLVCPLGSGVAQVWDRLVSGASGIAEIDHFDTDGLSCRIGGRVFDEDSVAEGEEAASSSAFRSRLGLTAKERKRIDPFIQYAIVATAEALSDSGYAPADDEAHFRTGVLIGSGIGGVQSIDQASQILQRSGPRRVGPFCLPYSLSNMLSGEISIRYGYRGPNFSLVSACATGTHALGEAARLIACDEADVMVAGGAEAGVTRLGFTVFCATRALSTSFNDRATAGSRPWDKARDGFVMGEGAGVVILEEYEHALKRGARVYGEVSGYGLSSDGFHITAPDDSGESAYRAMHSAFSRSGLSVEEIGYGNAHSTSTPLGDDIELRILERLYGASSSRLSVSSTKSSTGHLLGAAGAIEAIFALQSLTSGALPPTLNLESPSYDTPIDRVPLQAREKSLKAVFSNSFGFGGTNACIVFTRI